MCLNKEHPRLEGAVNIEQCRPTHCGLCGEARVCPLGRVYAEYLSLGGSKDPRDANSKGWFPVLSMVR